jgi:hypothetical protein
MFPKRRILVLVAISSLIGLLALAHPAAAQCTTDPPTGTSSIPNCEDGHANTVPGPTIFRVPMNMFLRTPFMVAAAYWISQSRTSAGQQAMVKPQDQWTLRGGRSPKQVAR